MIIAECEKCGKPVVTPVEGVQHPLLADDPIVFLADRMHAVCRFMPVG